MCVMNCAVSWVANQNVNSCEWIDFSWTVRRNKAGNMVVDGSNPMTLSMKIKHRPSESAHFRISDERQVARLSDWLEKFLGFERMSIYSEEIIPGQFLYIRRVRTYKKVLTGGLTGRKRSWNDTEIEA